MVDGFASWSLRSVLISVSDLNRSQQFYLEVMGADEAHREDQIAFIGMENQRCTVYLREVSRFGSREGEQALGVRALFMTVGSFDELDRVEKALRDHKSFRDRPAFDDDSRVRAVRGFDPDRLPLAFVAKDSGVELSPADLLRIADVMYSIDV
jgi:catechol 2,3-dioxygenase-like lactoylglutathione lyase family enzyme